jgi:predicted porin
MKKTLLITAILAAVLASTAQAQVVSVVGDIGVTSNYIDRGVSMSNKNPSVGGTIGLQAKVGPVDAFVNGTGDTINPKGSNLKALGKVEAGAGLGLLGASVQGGLRQYMNFGNPGTSLNFREAFVRASLPVAAGRLFGEYNYTVQSNTLGLHDTFASVGYEHSILTPALVMGGLVEVKNYKVEGITKVNDIALTARYNLTKQLNVYAQQNLGGKDAADRRLDNLTSVGVRYSF